MRRSSGDDDDDDTVVVLRAPDSAPLKSKMIYASSKDAIKKKLTGDHLTRHFYCC